MNRQFTKILYVIAIALVSATSFAAEPPKTAAAATPDAGEEVVCEVDSKLTDISYEDLRKKLESVLNEKNKSLTFLDLKSLQAQMDIMVSHLVSESEVDKSTALTFLERTGQYYEQLGLLLEKTKDTAKTIKDDHVVPLATVTSLKAEVDMCHGLASQYADVFRILSQLNRDLNEILMLSPSRINSQKEKNKQLIALLKKNTSEQKINSKDLVENLNFIQRQISTITQTFDFNSRVIQLATAH
ncbi:MAG: hypothetical protein IT287_07400 [Bdellovibrionaceae bacterium]|nr:hypothetical protein [Pseudobdellovibrionaceae bacterium]